jgi:uncharacterized protein
LSSVVIIIGITFVVLICFTLGMSAFVGWKMTHKPRKKLTVNPEHYGMSYADVVFRSRLDGISLSGWHIPGAHNVILANVNPQLTVIFSHGYGGNRLEEGVPALGLAKSLVGKGYDVLMYDFRNCGQSGGKLTSVGYYEKLDVLGAIDWVKKHSPENRIVLLGFSMGGISSLLAAAEETDVSGVISDSTFDDLRSYLKQKLTVWSGLPRYPFTPLILWMLPYITGISADEVNGFAAVDRIYPRPILFIHNREDTSIPFECSERMWSRHKDRFECLFTRGGGHVGSHAQHPEVYKTKILDFLNKL